MNTDAMFDHILLLFFSLRNAQGWTEPVSCTDHTSAHILNKPGSQEGEAVPYISPCLQPQAVQEHQIRLTCSAQHPMLHENQISTTSSSAADGTRLPWARLFILGPGQASITVSPVQLEKGKQRQQGSSTFSCSLAWFCDLVLSPWILLSDQRNVLQRQ